MKGLLFHNQLEFKIDVAGEEFRQGDAVECTLSVKNRSSDSKTLGVVVFALARGDIKKIKQKSADAFEVLEQVDVADFGALAPDETKTISGKFELEENCLLSERSKSLCLLYGLDDGEESRAHLQLSVLPHSDLEGIIGIFETSFQFLLKSVKSKKDWVTAVFKAPEGPGYRALSELELRLRFEAGAVQLLYLFKVEKLGSSGAALKVEKQKIEYPQELSKDQYMSSAGYVDPVRLEPIIREALSQVTSKF